MSKNRMTVEQWHAKLNIEGIKYGEAKEVLWDWQNDRVELLEKIEVLEKETMFLNALEEAGVDNWEGYSHAHEILDEWKKEMENEQKDK